ncbi:MAG: type IV pilin protein [Burkholderiaceae bacterium]
MGSRTTRTASPDAGFTLIEVMITVAIIAILASIAVPSYRDYVIRGAISEAASMLSGLRTRMEQYYLDNRVYGTGSTCGLVMPTLDANRDQFSYECAVGDAGTSYVITATGVTGKPSEGFVYTINQDGEQRTTAVTASWAATTTVPANRWIARKGG